MALHSEHERTDGGMGDRIGAAGVLQVHGSVLSAGRRVSVVRVLLVWGSEIDTEGVFEPPLLPLAGLFSLCLSIVAMSLVSRTVIYIQLIPDLYCCHVYMRRVRLERISTLVWHQAEAEVHSFQLELACKLARPLLRDRPRV